MTFAGINDQLCRHTERLQSMPEFVGLRRGAFRVVLTHNDQGRCLYVLNKTNGRTFLVNGGLIVNWRAEERDHPLAYQVLSIVTLPVGNACAGDSGLETVGLRDSPHGHVTAVTPSSHAETRRIDWIFLYCCINSGEDVTQIAAAEIFYIGAGELFSLTITSARVRHQHVVTA